MNQFTRLAISGIFVLQLTAHSLAAPPADDDPRFKAVIATEEMQKKGTIIPEDKLFEVFAGKSFASVAKRKNAPRVGGNRLIFTYETEKNFFGSYKSNIRNVDSGESWHGTWYVKDNKICQSLTGLSTFCDVFYKDVENKIYRARGIDSTVVFEYFTSYTE